MSAPPRPWRRRLLALGLSFAASFLVAEVFVRATVGAPLPERLPILPMRANPHRGWEMVPGVHYTYDHAVNVNALGLRGPELAAKAPSEVRVLALGDSLVYGQGVGEDETLPALLEVQLEAADPGRRPWTVVNAGHRAYDTAQELALLDELGEAIDPDVVVLCWYWNDLDERDVSGTYQRLKDRGVLAFDTGTRIEGGERVRWQARELLRRSALLMYVHDLFSRSQTESLTDQEIEPGLERLPGYLERLAARCRALGARPLFAAIPDPASLFGPHPSDAVVVRALALAAEAGIPALSLAPPLLGVYEEDGQLPVIPFDGHYLPRGNLAMAQALVSRVLEAEAAPTEPPTSGGGEDSSG